MYYFLGKPSVTDDAVGIFYIAEGIGKYSSVLGTVHEDDFFSCFFHHQTFYQHLVFLAAGKAVVLCVTGYSKKGGGNVDLL